jgi:hypothetical protein
MEKDQQQEHEEDKDYDKSKEDSARNYVSRAHGSAAVS